MRRVGILKILDGMLLPNWLKPKSAKSKRVHGSNESRIVPWNTLLLTRNTPENTAIENNMSEDVIIVRKQVGIQKRYSRRLLKLASDTGRLPPKALWLMRKSNRFVSKPSWVESVPDRLLKSTRINSRFMLL